MKWHLPRAYTNPIKAKRPKQSLGRFVYPCIGAINWRNHQDPYPDLEMGFKYRFLVEQALVQGKLVGGAVQIMAFAVDMEIHITVKIIR
ncbi:hypothetical protein Sbal625DRAFT_3274 [Shewanella baltica OS625]|nr:hypothetical protein Sbal625DRAFT_3274 [Shewanella baltica OS625]